MSLSTSLGGQNWGLNLKGKQKQEKSTAPTPTQHRKVNGFDSSSEDEDEESHAYQMNQQVLKQAAKERADRTLKSVMDSDSGDDSSNGGENNNEYDVEFQKLENERSAAKRRADKQYEREQQAGDNKPKYMENLLHQAKLRDFERDKAHERKMLKEQKEDETLYEGKERFVTSSYKRKLEEREEFEKESKRIEEEEKRNDVRLRKGGMGNFHRNVESMNSNRNTNIQEGEGEGEGEEVVGEEGKGEGEGGEAKKYMNQKLAEDNNGDNIVLFTKNDDDTVNKGLNSASFLTRLDKKEIVGPTREEILQERTVLVVAARKRYFQRLDLCKAAS